MKQFLSFMLALLISSCTPPFVPAFAVGDFSQYWPPPKTYPRSGIVRVIYGTNRADGRPAFVITGFYSCYPGHYEPIQHGYTSSMVGDHFIRDKAVLGLWDRLIEHNCLELRQRALI